VLPGKQTKWRRNVSPTWPSPVYLFTASNRMRRTSAHPAEEGVLRYYPCLLTRADLLCINPHRARTRRRFLVNSRRQFIARGCPLAALASLPISALAHLKSARKILENQIRS